MKSIKEKNLYRLFSLLSKTRKNQIFFLFFLLIINGISESIAVFTIVPFLSLIISGKNNIDYSILNNYLPINVTNYSEILFYLTLLFCIFIIFSTLIRIYNNWYILKLTANINIDFSNYIFKNHIYQSYTDYSKKSSSNIISLITEKVSACSGALNSIFTILLGLIIGFSIVIPLLFYSWRTVLISFILLYFYYVIISKKVRKILLNNGKIIANNSPIMIKIIQESFIGFRDIIINGTENIYLNLFNKYNSITKYKKANSQLIILLPKFLIEGITFLAIAIVGYILSTSSNQNSNFIPLFGSFVYALQRLLPLSQLTYAAWAGYKEKSESISNVLQELKIKNPEKFLSNEQKLVFKDAITFKNVSYSYDSNKKILNNICLSIKKGDHVGIYGETGSGKSTFLDLLMGLLPPQKGSIFIDKQDLFKDNAQNYWTSMISHVPQNIFLKEGNIAENIAFGHTMDTLNFDLLERSSKIAQIYKFIKKNKNGFLSMVGERGIRLSGGQRQRIAIARSLYKQRGILVLDEATSALDERTESIIIDKILRAQKDFTIIMVTHRINSLKNCNRIFKVTAKGEIIEE